MPKGPKFRTAKGRAHRVKLRDPTIPCPPSIAKGLWSSPGSWRWPSPGDHKAPVQSLVARIGPIGFVQLRGLSTKAKHFFRGKQESHLACRSKPPNTRRIPKCRVRPHTSDSTARKPTPPPRTTAAPFLDQLPRLVVQFHAQGLAILPGHAELHGFVIGSGLLIGPIKGQ